MNDPADRLRRVREAIATEGRRLADLMARTDNQGQISTTDESEDR